MFSGSGSEDTDTSLIRYSWLPSQSFFKDFPQFCLHLSQISFPSRDLSGSHSKSKKSPSPPTLLPQKSKVNILRISKNNDQDTIFFQVKGSSKTSSHQQPVKAAPTKKPTTTTTTTMKKSNLSKETPPPAQRRTRNSSVESVDESLDSDSDSEEKKHPKKVISKKSGGGGSAMSSPKVTLTSFPSFSNFSDFFPTSSILFCVEEVFLGRWWWWIRFLLHATHRGTSTKKLEIWEIIIKLSWKRKSLTMHNGCGTTKTIKWKFEM